MLWGRISDKFGRKPVLILGLVGTLISNLIFGFAKSFPVALIARALGGGLNGNIGVIQTTVAELVTEKEHQRKIEAILALFCLDIKQPVHLLLCHLYGTSGPSFCIIPG